MLRRSVYVLICCALAGSLTFSSCIFQRKTARRGKYMQHTYAAIKEGLNEADVTILSDSIHVLFPRNVMFDYNMAVVREDFFPILHRFAGILSEYKKTGILVVGHTDSVGGDNLYNTLLSRRRADSARAVLEFDGVRKDRLDSWGLGAKDPIASNASELGRARNRRVEFIVLYNYKKGSVKAP